MPVSHPHKQSREKEDRKELKGSEGSLTMRATSHLFRSSVRLLVHAIHCLLRQATGRPVIFARDSCLGRL